MPDPAISAPPAPVPVPLPGEHGVNIFSLDTHRGKWHHVEIDLTNRRVFVCSIDGKPQSGKWFTPGTLRPKVADGPWRVILDRKLEESPPVTLDNPKMGWYSGSLEGA